MILLTGASGFIGKHLLSALILEYGRDQVLALTSTPHPQANCLLHNDYDFEDDFFLKTAYGNKINTIIHAGAFTPKNNKQANDWRACNSNIYTTGKLLQAVLPNLKKVIYLSTLDVYRQCDIISESSDIQPISLYGESKLYIERMIGAWANQHNKIQQVLRVGHVYGPGEEAYEKIIPATIKKLLNNQPLQIWGTGKEIRSFIYIKDIVCAVLATLKLDADIGPVNLTGGQKITISELVDKLNVLSGMNASVEVIPAKMLGRDLIFDNTKMKEYLLPHETKLDDGLLEEWNSMKNLQA